MAPEGVDNLRDLLIFVEESSGAITASDLESVEVDHVARLWTHRCGLVEGSVGAVPVVVVLVQCETGRKDLRDPLRPARASRALR